MKQLDSHGGNPCSLSAHCIRLIDEMDPSNDAQQRNQVFSALDTQDQRLLEQLRVHIPTCPTCSATLAQARHIRSQQRTALSKLLARGEQLVPSTTAQIIDAIRREEELNAPLAMNNHQQENIERIPTLQLLNEHQQFKYIPPITSRTQHLFRNLLLLAIVVIVIFAAGGLFGRLGLLHTNIASTPAMHSPVSTGMSTQSLTTVGSSPTAKPSPTATPSPDITALSHGWTTIMYAIGPSSGDNIILAGSDYRSGIGGSFSNKLAANSQFDSISPDGKNLLYQSSSSGYTMYYTLMAPLPQTGFFYELATEKAGNAIWMTDSRHVLILAQNSGIMEVDTQTGQAQDVLQFPLDMQGQQVEIGRLAFFRDSYVYFTGGAGLCESILCRIEINSTNREVQGITMRSPASTYWLSPDGSTVYYINNGANALVGGIYAVDNNGKNHRLLSEEGVPIGFAADESLMIMRQINSKFQILKLNGTPYPGQNGLVEEVVFPDAAPGANSLCDFIVAVGQPTICDKSVALAPYGHAIVVQAMYPDGRHILWSINLITGKRVQVLSGTTAIVQLLGWSRMASPQG